MEERYGRPQPRLSVIGVVLFALFTAFVAWSGWHYATTSIRTQVVSFSSTDTSMVIRYQLTRRDAGSAITCRVSAQDFDRRVVGEITDQIPAGLSTLTRTVEVPTLKKAVAGFVDSCQRR